MKKKDEPSKAQLKRKIETQREHIDELNYLLSEAGAARRKLERQYAEAKAEAESPRRYIVDYKLPADQ